MRRKKALVDQGVGMWWNTKTENIEHFYIVKVSPYFIFKADFQAPIHRYHRTYWLIFLKY